MHLTVDLPPLTIAPEPFPDKLSWILALGRDNSLSPLHLLFLRLFPSIAPLGTINYRVACSGELAPTATLGGFRGKTRLWTCLVGARGVAVIELQWKRRSVCMRVHACVAVGWAAGSGSRGYGGPGCFMTADTHTHMKTHTNASSFDIKSLSQTEWEIIWRTTAGKTHERPIHKNHCSTCDSAHLRKTCHSEPLALIHTTP